MKTPLELIQQHRSRLREQQVFEALVSRAPNGMRDVHLKRLLPDLTEEQLAEALRVLLEKKLLTVSTHDNKSVPGRVITIYALAEPMRYPVKESIRIGAVDFPRAFNGDLTGAEDLNTLTEAIAEYDATIERRITELAASMTRRYWANVATLFALFVAVFALILRGSDPIAVSGSADAADLILLHAARLFPLAIILFGFAIGVWALVRKM